MKKIKKNLVENKDTVVMLLVPIAIVAKLIEHILLPDKYFYDSNRILITSLHGMVEGYSWGGNYEFTANLFAKLNFFNLTTLLQWSVLISIICNIILLVIFTKIKGMDLIQSIFALMCLGLCNIYVFNIGKDIVQYVFFIMCFIIISIERFPLWLRVIGCALIFYWESSFFRTYYIIMAAFTIGTYLVFKIIRERNIRLNIRKILLIISVFYLMMYMFLGIAKIFMSEEYDAILTCKHNIEYLSGDTRIFDQIEFGTNINLYMLNYIINSIRMMFPFELLSSGIFYIPFFIFQILLIYYLYKNIKNIHVISNKNLLATCVYLAFFMGSVLFEPDFGSWARHEAASFPMIILFAIDNLKIMRE